MFFNYWINRGFSILYKILTLTICIMFTTLHFSLPLSEFATNEAIQCTEIYEYANSLGNPSYYTVNFQVGIAPSWSASNVKQPNFLQDIWLTNLVLRISWLGCRFVNAMETKTCIMLFAIGVNVFSAKYIFRTFKHCTSMIINYCIFQNQMQL